MSSAGSKAPRTPPRWFVHTAARTPVALPGQRRPLPLAPVVQAGMGCPPLTTMGRTSGHPRTVIVGYLEDGDDLVTLAMNGWDEGHPSWWLNLLARPDAVVRLSGGRPRPVRARAAVADERDRLWRLWSDVDQHLDAYAGRRQVATPVVVLEPRIDSS
jgi:F420H(2)-dependent quinone reductase